MFLLLAFFGQAAFAAKATQLTQADCGRALTRGSYVVTTDMVCFWWAFRIIEDRVTLDLNGKRLSVVDWWPYWSSGIYVVADKARIEGNGARLSGFTDGILIGPGGPDGVGPQGVTVSDLEIVGNQRGAGIAIGLGATNNRIVNVRASGHHWGISFYAGAISNSVRDSYFWGNNLGITVSSGATRNRIINNVATESIMWVDELGRDRDGVGIILWHDVTENLVEGNDTSDNEQYGIVSYSWDPDAMPSNNRIVANTAADNGVGDYLDGSDPCTNLWAANNGDASAMFVI